MLRTQVHAHDEEGVAMVTVLFGAMIVFLALAMISSSLMAGVKVMSSTKAATITLSAAESATDRALFENVSGECEASAEDGAGGFSYVILRDATPHELLDVQTTPVFWEECPRDGDRYFQIRATGIDERGNSTTITSTYAWTNEQGVKGYDADATARSMPELIERTESRGKR